MPAWRFVEQKHMNPKSDPVWLSPAIGSTFCYAVVWAWLVGSIAKSMGGVSAWPWGVLVFAPFALALWGYVPEYRRLRRYYRTAAEAASWGAPPADAKETEAAIEIRGTRLELLDLCHGVREIPDRCAAAAFLPLWVGSLCFYGILLGGFVCRWMEVSHWWVLGPAIALLVGGLSYCRFWGQSVHVSPESLEVKRRGPAGQVTTRRTIPLKDSRVEYGFDAPALVITEAGGGQHCVDLSALGRPHSVAACVLKASGVSPDELERWSLGLVADHARSKQRTGEMPREILHEG